MRDHRSRGVYTALDGFPENEGKGSERGLGGGGGEETWDDSTRTRLSRREWDVNEMD
jgi:hypothetical protein